MDIVRDMRNWRVVSHRLRYWAETTPDAPFVKCGSPWLTFSDLETQTTRLAAGLQELGIKKGDRVAIVLPNTIEMVLLIYALAKMGAIQVPLNTFLKGTFLQYQIDDASAGIVIADQPAIKEICNLRSDLPHIKKLIGVNISHEELAATTGAWTALDTYMFEEIANSSAAFREVDLKKEDLISIMYTSGTTGLPKGCMLSNGYYTAIPWAFYEMGFTSVDDKVFTGMPLFHLASGAIFMMEALQGGIPINFEPSFSARSFIRRAAEEQATLAHCIGAMGQAILSTAPSEYDTKHQIRHFMIQPITPEDQARFERRFATKVFPLGYGQTEVSPATFGSIDVLDEKRQTVGRAPSHHEVTIRDEGNAELPIGKEGEICVRPREPEVMFQGYWNKPEATEKAFEEGWFHTGDLGIMDEDGYIVFRGRKSDSMRRRGENVAAFEVENAVVRHPKISAVAAHPVPSELSEDDIKLCIVLEPDQEFSAEEMFSYLQETLPYFAMPRYVEFLDNLPLTATGRVMKHKLKKRSNDNAIDFDALGYAVKREDRR